MSSLYSLESALSDKEAICIKCGEKLRGAKFCHNCGTACLHNILLRGDPTLGENAASTIKTTAHYDPGNRDWRPWREPPLIAPRQRPERSKPTEPWRPIMRQTGENKSKAVLSIAATTTKVPRRTREAVMKQREESEKARKMELRRKAQETASVFFHGQPFQRRGYLEYLSSRVVSSPEQSVFEATLVEVTDSSGTNPQSSPGGDKRRQRRALETHIPLGIYECVDYPLWSSLSSSSSRQYSTSSESYDEAKENANEREGEQDICRLSTGDSVCTAFVHVSLLERGYQRKEERMGTAENIRVTRRWLLVGLTLVTAAEAEALDHGDNVNNRLGTTKDDDGEMFHVMQALSNNGARKLVTDSAAVNWIDLDAVRLICYAEITICFG